MNASGARLEALTKDLRLRWFQTKDYWTDAKCQEFDQKYMQELFAGVDRAVEVIEKLDHLMGKVRKDCE
jgi:hypothetical protein